MLTGEQIRGARAMLRLEQSELAEGAGVPLETIKKMEKTAGPISALFATLDQVRFALEAAGVEFLHGDEPGAKLRNAK